MVWVSETELIGYGGDVLVFFGEENLGKPYDMALNVLLGCLAGLALDKVAEIVGRETHLGGTGLDSGDTGVCRPVAVEIVSKICIELADDAMVRNLACHELPFVEPLAMVEQRLDARAYYLAGMTVDTELQLGLYLGKTAEHNLFLAV